MNWKLACIASAVLMFSATAASGGQFVGRVVVEWVENDGPDRDMRTREAFAYRDDSGKLWSVPSGVPINGASIPRVFWTLVGPPFVGDYRRASVVHDYYCDAKTETWESVHWMFYEACMAGGVPLAKAKVMYAAVYGGGPRWERLRIEGLDDASEVLVDVPPMLTDEQLRSVVDWVEQNNPSLEDIRETIESRAQNSAGRQ